MTGKMLVALAATLACALPTAALAGSTNTDVIVNGDTGAVTRTRAVTVADLNLASERGYRTADSRLVRAAKSVCGHVSGSIMPVTEDYRTCFGSAIDGARSDLDTLKQAQGAG
jgi:UrcA family protein